MHMQVATFIVQKIILDEAGLQYICATPERFFGIAIVLARMVAEQPSTRLLKHIVRCYLRLTDDPRWVLSFVLGTYFITCNISSHTTMLISSFSKKKKMLISYSVAGPILRCKLIFLRL